MAGAFTHFLISDTAKRKRSVIGSELYRLLNKHSEFVSLGSVSPDLPYLSFRTGTINWADLMHYDTTNGIVIHGHDELRQTWSMDGTNEADEIKLAWLFGYASHLISDATIHPIVEAIVGPYKDNPNEHRVCEMTQDSLVYHKRKNAEIRYTEYSSIIKFCKESEHFDPLMDFWEKQAVKTYTDTDQRPNPSLWFKTYSEAIDIAEGGSYIIALFRHAGLGTDYLYKTREEIVREYPDDLEKYYAKVRLPNDTIKSFSTEGFDRAVTNVTDAWSKLYEGLNAEIKVSRIVRNWDLDTGVDMESADQIKTYWA